MLMLLILPLIPVINNTRKYLHLQNIIPNVARCLRYPGEIFTSLINKECVRERKAWQGMKVRCTFFFSYFLFFEWSDFMDYSKRDGITYTCCYNHYYNGSSCVRKWFIFFYQQSIINFERYRRCKNVQIATNFTFIILIQQYYIFKELFSRLPRWILWNWLF